MTSALYQSALPTALIVDDGLEHVYPGADVASLANLPGAERTDYTQGSRTLWRWHPPATPGDTIYLLVPGDGRDAIAYGPDCGSDPTP